MARLPTRKELADKIDALERDLKVATAGAAGGAILARSPTARIAALSGAARVSPYALAIDALVREEESLLGRGAIALSESAMNLASGVEARARREGLPIADRPAVAPKKKRPKSKFNKAIAAGMKVAKASTSYGKKGTINNAKKAFSAVTKTASAINKGKKVAKSGIKRKIGLAIKRIL